MERTSSVLKPSSWPKLTKPGPLGFFAGTPEIAGSIFHVESRTRGIDPVELNSAFGVGNNFLRSTGVNPESSIRSLEHRACFGSLGVPRFVDVVDDASTWLRMADHERQPAVSTQPKPSVAVLRH